MTAVNTNSHRYVKIFGNEEFPEIEGLVNGTFWNLVQSNLRDVSNSTENMKLFLSEYLPEAWIPRTKKTFVVNFFRVACDEGLGGGFEYGLFKNDDIWMGTENSFRIRPQARKILFTSDNLEIAFWLALSKAVLGTAKGSYALWYEDIKLFME